MYNEAKALVRGTVAAASRGEAWSKVAAQGLRVAKLSPIRESKTTIAGGFSGGLEQIDNYRIRASQGKVKIEKNQVKAAVICVIFLAIGLAVAVYNNSDTIGYVVLGVLLLGCAIAATQGERWEFRNERVSKTDLRFGKATSTTVVRGAIRLLAVTQDRRRTNRTTYNVYVLDDSRARRANLWFTTGGRMERFLQIVEKNFTCEITHQAERV